MEEYSSTTSLVSVQHSFNELVRSLLMQRREHLTFFTRKDYKKSKFIEKRKVLFKTLFTCLHSPYTVSKTNSNQHNKHKFEWDSCSELAVQCIKLRQCGNIKDAERLQELLDRLKLSKYQQYDAVLCLLLLLCNTCPSPKVASSVLNEVHLLPNQHYKKYTKSWFQVDDISRFEVKTQWGDLEESNSIFGSSLEQVFDLKQKLTTSSQFNTEEKGYSLFWLEPDVESQHSKETRTTLFNALTHSRTSQLEITLQLPELPMDPTDSILAHPSRKTIEAQFLSEDEGFTEYDSSISPSHLDEGPLNLINHEAAKEGLLLSVWDKALNLTSHRILNWEQFGEYNRQLDNPYISEYGADAFDRICSIRRKEVQRITGIKSGVRVISEQSLIRQLKNVLLGLPSTVFLFDRSNFSFSPEVGVMIKGMTPEALHCLLYKFADIGTSYQRVNKFAKHHSRNRMEMSGGLTLQAFIRGVEDYLFTYKEAVISLDEIEKLTLLKVWVFFHKYMKQLKILADICLCSWAFARAKNTPKPKFPTGLRLLSYLCELCSKNNSGSSYYMLLHLLKATSLPFIRFVADWLFHGYCNDPYGEFLIDVDDQYLSFRDKHYWTHGFKLKTAQDDLPLFLGELAQGFFVCGKGINLLRLTYPKHYLFECNIDPPDLKLNFSMMHLEEVESLSLSYSQKVLSFAEKRRQENLEMAVEEEIEREAQLAKRRQKTEELLRTIKDMETKVKEAIHEKKRQELKFLKEQMETALQDREEKRQKDREEDLRILSEAEKLEKEGDERIKRAREELIQYYERLSREAERREKKALWLISRHELSEKRHRFLMEDNERIEREEKEENQREADKLEKLAVTRQMTITWLTRRRELNEKRRVYLKGEITEHQEKERQLSPVDSDGVDGPSRLEEIILSFNPEQNATQQATERQYEPTISTDHVRVGEGHLDTMIHDFTGMVSTDSKPVSQSGEMVSGETVHKTSKENSLGFATEMPKATVTVLQTSVPQTSLTTNSVAKLNITSQNDSTAQALMYPDKFTAKSSTALQQEISPTDMSVEDKPPHKTSLQVSTAQDLFYPDRLGEVCHDTSSNGQIQIISMRFGATPLYEGSDAKNVLYPLANMLPAESNLPEDFIFDTPQLRSQSSQKIGGEEAKALLYPSLEQTGTTELYSKTYVGSSPNHANIHEDVGVKGSPPHANRESSSTRDFIGYRRKNLEPESKAKALIYGNTKLIHSEVEITGRQLTEEEVWLDSAVSPLKDNYHELDLFPDPNIYSNFARGSAGVNQSDNVEDAMVDAVEKLPLEIIIERSLTTPIRAQIILVNRAVVDFFIEELQIKSHFEAFRKFLLLEDGEFGFALCNELFEKVASGILPRQLCTSHSMNQIIGKALLQSLSATRVEFSKQLTFAIKWLPDIFSPTDISALDFLELRYKVPWPCNIVITETSISKYNKVFSFLLQLKKVNWVLQDVFRNLKRAGHDRKAAMSPQLRQLQLFRHEMQHFVNNVERYLVNQILDISWQEFRVDLKTKVHNLDDLHRCHVDYLNNIIFRSLLSKNAAKVLDIITNIFAMILQFHAQLLSTSWRLNVVSGFKVHPSFTIMRATHTSFKQYAGFLFTVVSKLVQRGYQSHLDDFLLQVDFNGFYSSTNLQQKY